jgi:hypothetical protein
MPSISRRPVLTRRAWQASSRPRVPAAPRHAAARPKAPGLPAFMGGSFEPTAEDLGGSLAPSDALRPDEASDLFTRIACARVGGDPLNRALGGSADRPVSPSLADIRLHRDRCPAR